MPLSSCLLVTKSLILAADDFLDSSPVFERLPCIGLSNGPPFINSNPLNPKHVPNDRNVLTTIGRTMTLRIVSSRRTMYTVDDAPVAKA